MIPVHTMANRLLIWNFFLLLITVIEYSDANQCNSVINMSNANITADMDKATLFDPDNADLQSIASLHSNKPFCFIPHHDFYLQVDFEEPVTLTTLKMKGYVVSQRLARYGYSLQFSFDRKTWLKYNEDVLFQKYFLLSFTNQQNVQIGELEKPVFFRYMRIMLNPPAQKGREETKLCLNFELRGCYEPVLPNIKTKPVVEGTVGKEEQLECDGDGVAGMTIAWKNLSSTVVISDKSSKNLMVATKSILRTTITLQDVTSLPCQMYPKYLVCVQNYTCSGSYSFNENLTVDVSSVLKVKVYFPSQPKKLWVKDKTQGSAVIAWQPPSTNNLTSAMLQYVLSCNVTGNFSTEILPMNVEKKLLSGLAVYRPYQCSLKVQMNENSTAAFPFNFTQEPVVLNFRSLSIAPKIKPEFNATVVSPTKIRADFLVKFKVAEYGVVSGFYLVATILSSNGVQEISLSNIPTSEQVIENKILNPNLRSFDITGVKPWSKYLVSLRAFNEDHLYTDNATEIVTTPEGVPSEGPKLVDKFLGKKRIMFKISFDNSFKNGEIVQYTVNILPGNFSINYPAERISVANIRGLRPYLSYSFRCKAKTKLGYGPYGKAFNVTTPEDLPSTPEGVQVVHVLDTNNLILRWLIPKQPNGNISKYEVRILLNNGTEFSSYATPDVIELFKVNVSKHDVAQVKVRACTGAGCGPPSSAIYPGEKMQEKTANQSLNDVILIVAFAAAVFFLLVLVVLCFLYHRRRGHPMHLRKDPITEPIFPRASSVPDDDDEYTIELAPRTRRKISDSIGTGSQSFINNTRDPVPVEEFSDYMNEAKNNDYEMLLEQFESIPSGKCSPWQAAELPENRSKNRYTNVNAYDCSRIILIHEPSKRKVSDYINASSANGYNHEDRAPYKYISTQGPLDHTQTDYWQMIWQEKITIIVMLTNLQENDKIKCSQYWPHELRTVYGNVSVTLDKIDKTADCVTRTFQVELTATKEVRTVLQFHFVSWPDHGVPDYPTAILSLRRRVRHYYDESKPMLVHCSAGIGRSGCFILIDAMLERIDKEKSVDCFNYLKYLRTRRINMVQVFHQYRFAHMAILEYITFGNTEIYVGELDRQIRQLGKNSGFENEFSLLTRNTTEQTGNLYRVLLREGRFIDAYHVDGYKQRDAFILTKASTENNVADFWKMVLEKQCHTIVMLNKCQETQQSYFKYWPDVDTHCVYGNTTVLTASEVANGNIITRKIKVTTNKRRCEVHHFQYVDWPDSDVPHRRGYSNICTLMQAVEKSQQNLGNGPIIVHEGNGYGRSGSFIAIYNSTERLKVEQLIDVLQCVRAIRIAQPLAVDNITQYQFVYNMLRTYLEGFENYWNYKDYKVTRSPLGSTSTN